MRLPSDKYLIKDLRMYIIKKIFKYFYSFSQQIMKLSLYFSNETNQLAIVTLDF